VTDEHKECQGQEKCSLVEISSEEQLKSATAWKDPDQPSFIPSLKGVAGSKKEPRR
jgi:hypothetical protein